MLSSHIDDEDSEYRKKVYISTQLKALRNTVLHITLKLYNTQCSIPTTGGDIQCGMAEQREQSRPFAMVMVCKKKVRPFSLSLI